MVPYSMKKSSGRVRNKIYLEYHDKNCSSCLHQAEFPEGMWVEKMSNILKHASASQHVQMLGILKSKMMISLPNSPLFKVSDLKVKFS